MHEELYKQMKEWIKKHYTPTMLANCARVAIYGGIVESRSNNWLRLHGRPMRRKRQLKRFRAY